MYLLRTCILSCLLTIPLVAGEAPSPVIGSDLREALAQTTRERDGLSAQVATLEQQRSLLMVVAGLLGIAVGMLVRARLLAKRRRSGAPAQADEIEIDEGDPFPEIPAEVAAAPTVTIRKNATITIRNGATQREEVTERVQTRRLFSTSDPRRTPRKETADDRVPDATPAAATEPQTPERGTVVTTRTRSRTNAAPAVEVADGELKPSTDRVARSVGSEANGTATGPGQRPATVRVDHQSDRMEVVEVSVKPGTTGIFRRQAFSILEIMVSLALLATVLTAIISSLYTLHRSRTHAMEQAQAEELARLFVERILAEPNWWALNSYTTGNMWIRSYADGSFGTPLTGQNLVTHRVVQSQPPLNNLKVFLERYRLAALEDEVRSNSTRILSDPSALTGYRDAYGNLYRIVIQWEDAGGGTRTHHQFIARQGDF